MKLQSDPITSYVVSLSVSLTKDLSVMICAAEQHEAIYSFLRL